MAAIASRAGDEAVAATCEAQATDAEKRVQPIRKLVLDPSFFGHGPEDH
jgi:hypothetical protein